MTSRILLIDNHEKSAATLRNHFRETGLAMERARGTGEALVHLAAESVDLILLHLVPPGGPGFEFIKTLRHAPATRTIPVIVMTSVYRGERYAEAARRLGVTAYLETPFSTDTLAKAIRRSLPTVTTVAMPVHRHLRRAFLSGFSGIHTVKSLSGDKHLVFFEGVPIHLSPGFFHPDFGRYLRHRNVISAQENGLLGGVGAGRHDTLVQMGCLAHPDLVQEKLRYLTEELIAAFGHGPAAVTEHSFRLPDGIQPVGVNVPEVFHQGYRRHADLPAFRRRLDSLGYQYVTIGENYYRFLNFLTLDDREKQFLKKLDGSHVLRECLVGSPEFESLVLTLYALNMIRFREAPGQPVMSEAAEHALREEFAAPLGPADEDFVEDFNEFVELMNSEAEIPEGPATAEDSSDLPAVADIRQLWEGMREKNYYQLFGLSPEGFSAPRLRDRYFDYRRQFTPNLLMRLTGETARQAQEILDRVAAAYNILADDLKRAHYDQLLRQAGATSEQLAGERMQARIQAHAGQAHLHREAWGRAEKAFRKACNLEPCNGEWLAHLAWAIYRNPSHAGSRVPYDRMINRALRLERTAQGHAYKGWMLLEAGRHPEAREEFTLALKLDPHLDLARKGLKAARKNPDGNGHGWWRRMLGGRQPSASGRAR